MSRGTREFRARVAKAANNIQCPVVGYEKMLDKSGKDLRSQENGKREKEERRKSLARQPGFALRIQ